jgi:2-hydroxychromene-2-carboxylate isomerase
MSVPALDFWFDLASTYSYPTATRIGALAGAAGVAVRFRPFLLGPIFKAQGWDTSPFNLYPAKGRHMWRDLERICAELKLPFRRPEPFPQSSLLAARVALVGLDAICGEDDSWPDDSWGKASWGKASWGKASWGKASWGKASWGKNFCLAVYRAEFADGLRIDEPSTIRAILSDLKVDPERAMAAAQTADIKDKLRTQTAEAQRLDIFGAPTFTTADGELFWGNDRLEAAIAWAKRMS